jgi:hypothetical protein
MRPSQPAVAAIRDRGEGYLLTGNPRLTPP